jgi:phosphoglycerol transferase MdoB-like AlkP superfamily enzyme
VTSEWVFWEEFNTRFNFISVDYLIYSDEVINNIYESYPLPWILTGIFFISLITFIFLKDKLASILKIQESVKQRALIFCGMLGLSLCSYFFIGQTLREFSDNNYVNELASNGPYQFVAALRNNTLDYKTFYLQDNDNKLSRILKSCIGKKPDNGCTYDISRAIESKGKSKKINVILISVESLSAKYLTRFGSTENITPFMDQWFKEGLLFTNFYATGTRTDRGLESITLSIPPTPGRSMVKRPDNEKIYSLGKVFKDYGYDVAFLYAGIGFFDNMNTFFSGNGYRIVDQLDFEENEITFQNAWGVSDEDLYNKAVKEANKSYEAKTPFFFHIMTTSNHRPYTYLDGKIDIPPGTGREGAVKYTDYALNQFVQNAKMQKWFDDTIFVIVADHCAGSAGKVGLPVDKYHIPLFIYSPKYITPGEVSKVASQIDIAPTLLSLLNVSYKSYFFGRNILSNDFVERALIGNYQKLGLYKNNKLIILSPQKKSEIIEDPYNSEIIREAKQTDQLVLETMAYYQGANYILKHKMNRWSDKDEGESFFISRLPAKQ